MPKLVQDDGALAPLTETYHAGRARQARVVEQINAALADRR